MQHAHLVVDLGFGDCGKGTIVDALVRKHRAHSVFRFNGGAQAAHNVVTPDGRHHTFSQFSSGTFVSGVRTILSEFMLVQPWALFTEEEHLQSVGVTDAFDRLFIHERALIITPFHRAANQLRERGRGNARHGSCGIGVGETAKDATECSDELVLRMGDICDRDQFIAKMNRVKQYKYEQVRSFIVVQRHDPEAEENILTFEDDDETLFWVDQLFASIDKFHIVDDAFIASILSDDGDVVFEGAQGVLLDEWRGFHPYTTWSTCTFDNALEILKHANYEGEVNRIGVVRAYATRHGAGPFVTEDAGLTERIPDTHNKTETWQQGFRIGWFDCVATRYAIAVCGGVDSLAVTCFDRLLEQDVEICTHYEHDLVEDDAKFFERDASTGKITSLKLGVFQDLAHQESLTHLLATTKPSYETIGHLLPNYYLVETVMIRLSQELSVPISVISLGVTATAKVFY